MRVFSYRNPVTFRYDCILNKVNFAVPFLICKMNLWELSFKFKINFG